MDQVSIATGPVPVHPDALELAALLRPTWPVIDARLRASGHPLCEGDGADGGQGGAGGDGGAGDGGTAGQGGAGGQEPKVFDEAYVKQLRSEAAANRTKATDLQTKLQEYEDRDKTDQQKLAERADAAEKEAQASKAQLLRFEVAAAKKLPPEFASRLIGNTKEDLEKDADQLLTQLGGGQQRPTFDGGVRQTPPQGNDMDAAIRAAARR